jgi:hypothetical protein
MAPGRPDWSDFRQVGYFLWGGVENYRSSKKIWATFVRVYQFLQTIGWATVWAIFSQSPWMGR